MFDGAVALIAERAPDAIYVRVEVIPYTLLDRMVDNLSNWI